MGGGICLFVMVEKLLLVGVEKVILGIVVFYDKLFLEEVVCLYKEKIIVGIDVKNGFVVMRGWFDLFEIFYVSLVK